MAIWFCLLNHGFSQVSYKLMEHIKLLLLKICRFIGMAINVRVLVVLAGLWLVWLYMEEETIADCLWWLLPLGFCFLIYPSSLSFFDLSKILNVLFLHPGRIHIRVELLSSIFLFLFWNLTDLLQTWPMSEGTFDVSMIQALKKKKKKPKLRQIKDKCLIFFFFFSFLFICLSKAK